MNVYRKTCLYRSMLLSTGAEPGDAQRSMHTMTHMQVSRKRPTVEWRLSMRRFT